MKNKVFLALSGGLDSSVAAAILKQEGFEVKAVYLRLFPPSNESELRAKRVTKTLNIPFLVLDFSREFKKKIIDYFIKGYKRGISPNPCVICNKEIKLGLFLEKTLKMGADFIATGHYARLFPQFPDRENTTRQLLRAKDERKDQSYFLWMLNQKQLKKIIFPLGDYSFKEVEKLAKKFNLPVLGIKKSVEICFVREKINDFLKKRLKEKPGKIINKEGKVLGKHKGLWFYTIGQRKGIFLSGGPYFVLDKDIQNNVLIVTKKESDLFKKELVAENVNWIPGREPNLPLKIEAKIRYKSDLAQAFISKMGEKKYKIKFSLSQRAITPGQSVVFYKGQELLGGGTISLK